ncbi:MAG: hypothetical protein HXY29_07375 [Rhodocyclaceae bacterium]|jgi:hypothetical protein|nr:hypothetical protein [Rhodocyclaceae bacterium]
MLNSYEAVYDHGTIRWIDQPPPLEKARVIVTVLPAANETPQPVASRRPSPKLRDTRLLVDAEELLKPIVPESDWDVLR